MRDMQEAPNGPTPLPDPARLFLALWPGNAARRALSGWQQAVSWPQGARLAAPTGLHLTLHFIGAVARHRLDELALGLAVAPSPPFTLRLGDFTVWRGGIAVLQAEASPPPLLELHARLAQALRELGLPVESRPFRPHVTLARHAAHAGVAGDTAPPPVDWVADGGYVLAESAGGYRVLKRFAGNG